jgi:hypothetical protein
MKHYTISQLKNPVVRHCVHKNPPAVTINAKVKGEILPTHCIERISASCGMVPFIRKLRLDLNECLVSDSDRLIPKERDPPNIKTG